MAKKKPDPEQGTTRVRLDLPPAEHRHIRVAAAEANLSMAKYALRLVTDDMKRKAKP